VRILWQNNTSENIPGFRAFSPFWGFLQQELDKVARPGTQVEVRHLGHSTNYVRSRYGDFVNNSCLVEQVLDAEEQGYDGVILGCFPDPQLYALREVMNIPVVGIGEAAMLTALALGYRFAVVTVDDAIVPNMDMQVRLYGLEDRAIYRPVRAVRPPFTREHYLKGMTDPHGVLVPAFFETARECVRDGAEVILIGCGYMGFILTSNGITRMDGEVPLVNPGACAVKLIEGLVDLESSVGLRKSTAGYFKPPGEGLVKAIRAAAREDRS
jgi:allantoin racemase